RFGIDFLYPVQRYIDGASNPMIYDRVSKASVTNPIYAGNMRNRNMVFWVGIVGVPWQDIAVDPSNLNKGLMNAKCVTGEACVGGDLESNGRWPVILGDPGASPPVLPTDPLMIESTAPRSGSHPLIASGAAQPPTATQGS